MFGIKTKIFLPMYLFIAAIGLYFCLVWIPKTVDLYLKETLSQLEHTLDIVGATISKDLSSGNTEAVKKTLSETIKLHHHWKDLSLTDPDGNLLGKVSSEMPEDGASRDIKEITSDIYFNRTRLGTMVLRHDFSGTAEKIRMHAEKLFLILVTSLCVFVFGASVIVQQVIISPVQKLTSAAENFGGLCSENCADLSSLRTSGDEIGRLVLAFSSMRNSIDLQQKSLASQNRELSIAKDQAEKANYTKSEFLANMSHELRTPLNSIIGLSRMLTENPEVDDENRKMADIVYKSSNSLLEIVNDILDISKIEAGSMALERIGFDIKMVVLDIIETMEPVAFAKNLSVNYDCDRDIPLVYGDPLRFGRILTNLVSNALKYTEHGGIEVTITATEREDEEIIGRISSSVVSDNQPMTKRYTEVYCSVIDTGIGIPKEKLQIIFEKFTQADQSTTRRFGGTGLGLAITKDLVTIMGGEIGVESTLGKGSTFWFRIPFEVADAVDEEFKNQQWKRHRIKKVINKDTLIPAKTAKVLIAEDHLLNQDFIWRLLKHMGFHYLDIADNGIHALEAALHNEYDLILMDCHMPEMSGYEVTKKIRDNEKKSGRRVPIIALTADAMKGTQDKCHRSGMDEYVTKPIDADELFFVLEHWVSFEEIPGSNHHHKETEIAQIPVNLDFIKGYAENEEEISYFIDLFVNQSDECIRILERCCIDGSSPSWCEASHKLKGGAGMIGANKLRNLCAEAQIMDVAKKEERKEILCEIMTEYKNVIKYVEENLT